MKTFAVSSMESAGPIATTSTTQEGLEHFTLVEKIWKFAIPSGYYLTRAEMNNLALYPSDQYISPLMISDDNLNWVPIEEAIGQRYDNDVLFVRTLQLDPLFIQSKQASPGFGTNLFDLAAYPTNDADIDVATVASDSVGYLYFTLDFSSTPVPASGDQIVRKFNFRLTSDTGSVVKAPNNNTAGTTSSLLALPWFDQVAIQIGVDDALGAALASFKIWLVRFQKGNLLTTLRQEYVIYYDSAGLGKYINLTGVSDGSKGTQGMILLVQPVTGTGQVRGTALANVYIQARVVKDQPYALPSPNTQAYALPSAG